MERVSKALKSSKHPNMWVQMKEKLNIRFLLFKYLVFFLVYASFDFGYHILHSFFVFYFVLNVTLRLFRIFESIYFKLVNARKRCFITINCFKNFVHLLWFKWHFNECTISKYRFFSWKPSPFIMIFIINHKTPTMTAQQFYKQTLIFTDYY